jgi:hypothetical protein
MTTSDAGNARICRQVGGQRLYVLIYLQRTAPRRACARPDSLSMRNEGSPWIFSGISIVALTISPLLRLRVFW